MTMHMYYLVSVCGIGGLIDLLQPGDLKGYCVFYCILQLLLTQGMLNDSHCKLIWRTWHLLSHPQGVSSLLNNGNAMTIHPLLDKLPVIPCSVSQ